MTKHKQKSITVIALITLLSLTIGLALVYPHITTWIKKRAKETSQQDVPPVATPSAQAQVLETQPPAAAPAVATTEGNITLPTEVNLSVPFTSQAPTANWDSEHEELCEEASALMVDRFFHNQAINDAADAEASMQTLATWELKTFGTMESTTAEQTARMIRSVYNLNVVLKNNPTADDLKQTLANGALVIVPAAGRELDNPYFKQPGPLYHMLVIKGYTKSGDLITNDPGTKHGADYVYEPTTLLNAIGDWNNGDPANGKKVVLIVSN